MPPKNGEGGLPAAPDNNPDAKSIPDALDRFHLDAKPFAEGGHFPSVVFAYRDKEGQPVGAVARFEAGTLCPDDKEFRQWRHDPGASGENALGFVSGLGKGESKRTLPLYRLPEIFAALAVNPAQTIHFVEGEKCADALAARGMFATTIAGGSSAKFHADVLEPLRGVNVMIWADCDQPGREYATRLARPLHGIAANVRIVELDPKRNDGFDVADFIADGASTRDVLALADAAPEWIEGRSAAHHADPVLVRLSDVEPESINWLWPQRIARGKLTLLVGDPGLGKSFVTLDLAARASIGAPWPDGSGNAPLGSVVLLSAEDGPADTIRPRLDAANANCEQIIVLQAVKSGVSERHFNLASDLGALRAAISVCEPPCTLVVIDPISAYLSGIDSHDNAAVRGVLAPLAALASETGVAILAVTHLRKGEGKAIYRAIGSLAFIAAARAAFCVAKDKDNEDRRLFFPLKNNIGNDKTGLAFTLESTDATARIAWEPDAVTISADEALETRRGSQGAESLGDACAFLQEALEHGPRPTKELFDEAKAEGISERTLKRAKGVLEIQSSKSGGSGTGWAWILPKRANGEAKDATGGSAGTL